MIISIKDKHNIDKHHHFKFYACGHVHYRQSIVHKRVRIAGIGWIDLPVPMHEFTCAWTRISSPRRQTDMFGYSSALETALFINRGPKLDHIKYPSI